MKLLYILYSDYEKHSSQGVMKKIDGEIKAFEELGYEVTLSYQHEGKLVNRTGTNVSRFQINRGLTRYRMSIYKQLKVIIRNQKYNMVYLRFPGSIDFSVFSLLKVGHRYCDKVVLEMPTYPIGGEMKERLKKLATLKTLSLFLYQTAAYSLHRILSRKLKKYVDVVLSFFDFDKIWGMPVINIDNGISLNDIKIQEKKREIENTIRLIFVAAYSPWHGVDRIVKSLDEYYKTKKISDPEIILKLVGSGDSLTEVIQTEYFSRVKSHIELLGPRHGKELDDLYDESDVAISSLGMFRIGLVNGSTLKTKEYCAKGIPFIYAYKEKLIDDSFKYARRFENDDSLIDMNSIIEFYYGIEESNYSQIMRKFAEKYEWKSQIKEFLSKLNSI